MAYFTDVLQRAAVQFLVFLIKKTIDINQIHMAATVPMDRHITAVSIVTHLDGQQELIRL